MNPFDFVNSILVSKKDIMDEESERFYSPFLTNRALSYYKDTLFYAQEMNLNHHLDKKLQFQYLINSTRASKRFGAKWSKKKESVDINAVMEYFDYNYNKAKNVVGILSKEQIKEIKRKLEKGGT